MKHCLYLLILFLLPVSVYSQDQLFGSWQGNMRSVHGTYTFTLDILSTSDAKDPIRAVAMHDRNGEREVIELKGIIYHDSSVYFRDVSDRFQKASVGEKFSKLQFLFKYENGIPMLDGHWQEYKDLKKYRKGRLVLYKKKRKA